MEKRPLRVAVIGLGGFAGRHHKALHALEVAGQCHVVAACDPHLNKFAELMRHEEFAERSICIYTDYLEMLDRHRHEIDFVTVPTPISLHAAMHRACVERGLACYLEKPPTLFWKELDEMLEVEKRASRQTQTGFAHIVEEPRQRLKRRLVTGEFGRIHRVGFAGQWPRDTAYFKRAAWAGRLKLDGRLVLDSCTGNAMSHYIHNALFWCGQGEVMSWGKVENVEAELYRAHSIENFDTCFACGVCENGVQIVIASTHTGEAESHHIEWLDCEKATIQYKTGTTIRIDIAWRGGGQESKTLATEDALTANFMAYVAYLRGEVTRPPTRLVDSLPFVHFNNLLYVAAGAVHNIAPEHISYRPNVRNESDWILVAGMDKAIEEFRSSSILPGKNGAPWGYPGGRASASCLPHLSEVIHRMETVAL